MKKLRTIFYLPILALTIIFIMACQSSNGTIYGSRTQNCIYDSDMTKQYCFQEANALKERCSGLMGNSYSNCVGRYCDKVRFCYKQYNISVKRCGGEPSFLDKANVYAPCIP